MKKIIIMALAMVMGICGAFADVTKYRKGTDEFNKLEKIFKEKEYTLLELYEVNTSEEAANIVGDGYYLINEDEILSDEAFDETTIALCKLKSFDGDFYYHIFITLEGEYEVHTATFERM